MVSGILYYEMFDTQKFRQNFPKVQKYVKSIYGLSDNDSFDEAGTGRDDTITSSVDDDSSQQDGSNQASKLTKSPKLSDKDKRYCQIM